MRFIYTEKHLVFLREGYKAMQVPELTAAFNERFGTSKTEVQIKSTLANHKITCGRPTGLPKGHYHAFTAEQGEFIREQYRALSLRDLTSAFNARFGTSKSNQQIRSFTRNHTARSGRTGQFERGCKSWNAGTKGVVKPNSGSFTKGSVPGNRKPIGSERICAKDGYILIKVAQTNPYTGAPTRYLAKHRVVWEAANGPLPRGHVLSFRDGNKLNCELDNIILLSMAESLYLNRNGYSDLPDDLKPLMLTAAKLATRAHALERPRND